jgi:prolyl oligopeptidase
MRQRPSLLVVSLVLSSALGAGCGPGEPAKVVPPVTSAPVSPGPSASVAAPSGIPYPAAPKVPVITEFFGTKVTDDYQWLEASKAPEVRAFVAAQNQVSQQYLAALSGREVIGRRARALLSHVSPKYLDVQRAGGQWFVLTTQPPRQQPFIVKRASLESGGAESVVIDANLVDTTGKTTIDFFVPSPDGKTLAVSLSSGGSESGDVHFIDVATAKDLGHVQKRVYGGTAGGSLVWDEKGTGVFFTRYPREGERPPADKDFYQQVYFQTLPARGTAAKIETYELGKELPRIAEVELKRGDGGRAILAEVQNGDGGEFMHFVRLGGKWKQLSQFADEWSHASFGRDGSLFVMSRKGAPRGKVLRLRKPYDPAKAEVVLPESDGVVESLVATENVLYVVELVGGPSRLRAVPLKGKAKTKELPTLPVSATSHLVLGDGDDLFFRNESFTEPSGWYAYGAKTDKVQKTALVSTTSADMADVEVLREECTSKDGTKIPLNILRRKGTPLDGKRPTLLTGYGGYSVSRTPRLRPFSRIWLDQDGVFAEANLRGGGEYGEAWHQAGNLTRKQNVFDDFYACAQHLTQRGYTNPDKLAALGGSNGGLLMGATVVQHPEAFRAVVSRVGIYDMLRVELTPNGAFNVTEYGSVKDEAQFRALRAYSPFHNVKDGVRYPSMLFTTGDNDPRVDPFHSRKMLARLQAAALPGRPLLLVASSDTGHGMGTPLEAEILETTDIHAFLLAELGVTPTAPTP